MSIWVIIKNIGFILNFFKVMSSLVSDAIKGKKLPECESSREAIVLVKELIDRKIIDIPDFDESKISEGLGQILEQFNCSPKSISEKIK